MDIDNLSIKEGLVLTFTVLGVVLLITLIFGSFYIVSAGERAVLLTWGNPNSVPVSEGLHFKVPIMQKKIIFDVKTQKYEAQASSASKDLQMVSTNIAVNFHLSADATPRIYQEIGLDYNDRVIQPARRSEVKYDIKNRLMTFFFISYIKTKPFQQ